MRSRITSYNVCYTKLLRQPHVRDAVCAPVRGRDDQRDQLGLGLRERCRIVHERAMEVEGRPKDAGIATLGLPDVGNPAGGGPRLNALSYNFV